METRQRIPKRREKVQSEPETAGQASLHPMIGEISGVRRGGNKKQVGRAGEKRRCEVADAFYGKGLP